MKMFEIAPRVQDIAEQLIDDHHEHLQDAKHVIGFYLRKDGGVKWAGKCKKCTSFERDTTGKMFFIFIIDVIFERWPMEKLRALIDHELYHIERKRGPSMIHPITLKHIPGEWLKADNPDSWAIVEHDVEEFSDVIRRHGLWETGIERFAEAVRTAPYQMSLGDIDINSGEDQTTFRAVSGQ